MTMHELRTGALPVDVHDMPRSLAAPWIIDHTGSPSEFDVPAGFGLYYDLLHEIVHIRDQKTGFARTYAPNIDVFINHADAFFDISFRNTERPWVNYPSWQILNGRMQFIHADDFMASNVTMYQAVCRYLNSPIYNPFLTAITNNFDDEYVIAIKSSTISRSDGKAVDQAFSDVKSFYFRAHVPIPGYDRFETEAACMLPPGSYSAEAIQTNHETGEIVRFEVEGADDATRHMWRILVEHDDLFLPIQNGNVEVGKVEGPTPLDFDAWQPKTFTPSDSAGRVNTSGSLLDRLFGRV